MTDARAFRGFRAGHGYPWIANSQRRKNTGTVASFMVNKRTGQVAYAVMSFGGFLGLGKSCHPLPWHVLTYDTGRGGYVVDLDKEQLRAAPSFNEGDSPNWDDRAWAGGIDAYYADRPDRPRDETAIDRGRRQFSAVFGRRDRCRDAPQALTGVAWREVRAIAKKLIGVGVLLAVFRNRIITRSFYGL